MSVLSVKTKGNSSPQGKARVFFSCHPEDLEQCFGDLCDDIFLTQDPAIYYESDPDALINEAEFATLLSDIQLMVVPVTSKFLFRQSHARDFEYAFAMEHHIPILPIEMEAGCVELFADAMNRVGEGFGDIQLLSRVSQDQTVIPYAEKLEKLLNGVLVGDELAKRVRAAFGAYIFLSYRKKDRVYAKNLMKVIHTIPHCENIAIWYDEFLVPGEGWNRAIAEAMNKSELVTLAVTPSIIEPGNYIIDHEYPDAVKAGKEILPVELVPTDREALSHLFKGIKTPVDGSNMTELQRVLKRIAVQEKEESPERSFLLGLAYLSAIDVERDSERAVRRITAAAQAELPEAIRKLVSMYNTGEGVERNYLTAVQWQERLVEVLEKTKKAPYADREILVELWEAGDMWRSLGRLKEAKLSYERMLDYAEQRDRIDSSLSTKRDLAYSFSSLAFIGIEERNLDQTKDYNNRSLCLFEKIAKETKSEEDIFHLATCYDDMGMMLRVCGEMERSKEFFLKALHLKEMLLESTYSTQIREKVAFSYYNLADNCEMTGDFDGANSFFLQSLQEWERLVEEIGTADTKQELARLLNRLGMFSLNIIQDVKRAKEYIVRAVTLCEELVQTTQTLQSKMDLAYCYHVLTSVCAGMDDDSAILKEYTLKAMEIEEEVAEQTESVDAKLHLIVSYISLGNITAMEDNREEAKAFFQKAQKLSEGLRKEDESLEVIASRLGYSMGLFSLYYNDDDTENAVRYCLQTISQFEKLEKINCLGQYVIYGFECYNSLGDLYRKERKRAEAKQYYQKALSLIEKVNNPTVWVEKKEEIFEIYEALSKICKFEGNFIEAKAYRERAILMLEELIEEIKPGKKRKKLSAYFYRLGRLYYLNEDNSKAKESFLMCAFLAEELLTESDSKRIRRRLEKCYYKLYEICQEEGNRQEASMYYLNAVALMRNW